jgi:hypothetical protein
LDSRTICKKQKQKILKWLEEKTGEWHWKVKLSVKKSSNKNIKMAGRKTGEWHWKVELSVKKQKQEY